MSARLSLSIRLYSTVTEVEEGSDPYRGGRAEARGRKGLMPILMIHNVVGVVGVALDDLEIGRSKSIYVGKAQFAWWREVLYVEGLTFTHFQLLSQSQDLIPMLSLLVAKSG